MKSDNRHTYYEAPEPYVAEGTPALRDPFKRAHAATESKHIPGPLAWRAEGACVDRDPDLFFPPRGGSPDEGRLICFGCPVREACLEYALANQIKFGVWGGTSEKQRRQLRKLRAAS